MWSRGRPRAELASVGMPGDSRAALLDAGGPLSAVPRSPAPLTVEFGSQDDTCAVLPPGGGVAQVCDGSVGPLVQFCQY